MSCSEDNREPPSDKPGKVQPPACQKHKKSAPTLCLVCKVFVCKKSLEKHLTEKHPELFEDDINKGVSQLIDATKKKLKVRIRQNNCMVGEITGKKRTNIEEYRKQEEAAMEALREVRKRIKSEFADLCDYNFESVLLTEKEKQLDVLEKGVKDCVDAQELEAILNAELKEIDEWLDRDPKVVIAIARKEAEDKEKALLDDLSLLSKNNN